MWLPLYTYTFKIKYFVIGNIVLVSLLKLPKYYIIIIPLVLTVFSVLGLWQSLTNHWHGSNVILCDDEYQARGWQT